MAPSNGSAHLRLMVLGGPGVGKTTTANTILGREAFQEVVTVESSVQTRNIGGRCISLIDTPRFLLGSSSGIAQQNGEGLEKCLNLASPGPHAFLLVINLGMKLVSEEGTRAVDWIREQLGEEALRVTVVLFTRRERVTRRVWDHFLSGQEVQHVISNCGGGYHTMNSKAEIEPWQVTELLEKIDALVESNSREYYGIDMFLQARRRGKRKEEEVWAVVEKEERKLEDMRNEMEMRKQKREEERKRKEEERKKKELRELKERDRRRQQREERERVERERRTLEEVRNRQQQERQMLEEEERRQQEVRQRLAEEKRLQEEAQQRLEEERRLQEEARLRLEEERRLQEEAQQRLEEEREKQEMQRLAMERRRMTEGQNQQVLSGREGEGGRERQEGGAWTAEKYASVAGSFLAPFLGYFFQRKN